MQDQSSNIVRVKRRETPYVMLDKTSLNDGNLSWKAKGLHAYLISLPDEWVVRERDLAKRSKDGRDSVRSGIKELIEHGYIIRQRKHDKSGKFEGYETVVFEIPQPMEPKSENPTADKPESENPTSGKPTSENPTYNNKPGSNNPYKATKEATPEIFQEVQNHYMKAGWGFPNGFAYERLVADINDYGKDVVMYAIEIAGERNARTYSYTAGIYREWNDKNLANIEQIKEYEEAKKIQRAGGKPQGTQSAVRGTKTNRRDFFSELAASMEEEQPNEAHRDRPLN